MGLREFISKKMNDNLLPKFIELETSTQCNRACSWCPNSQYDRGEKQEYMEEDLFKKIVDDLSGSLYSGQIALHNFNEPLLDENLFRNIEIIRDQLINACLVLFSNGDFLDCKKMEELEKAGVKVLIIALHDMIGKDDYFKRIDRFMQKLGIEKELVDSSDAFGAKFKTSHEGMEIIFYIPFVAMLTSRGGIIKKFDLLNKNSFCYLPFSSCAIDYEGNLKICCEVYPANTVHREEGVVGSLKDNTFLELWFSNEFNAFRKSILECLNKNIICSHCPGYKYDVDENRMSAWKTLLDIF